MKIAINGDIIETDNIYKISDIELIGDGFLCLSFSIESFNDKLIRVRKELLSTWLPHMGKMIIYEWGDINKKVAELENDPDGLTKFKEHDRYIDSMEEINKIRDRILYIWGHSQTIEIEQFNIK